MTPIVEAHGLTKTYKSTPALDGLDLTVPHGQVLALLGPNGAGKTTFVRLLATLLRPDAGTLRVDGIDVVDRPQEVRRRIGLAGQFAAVEPALTGRENLHMVARLFGLDRSTASQQAGVVLDRLGLADAGDQLVREYSGGMRRRLDLGASLVGRPRLLLLDEPTTGLDPRSRLELWDAIRELVADGTDVLLTTQYLEEADQLAGQVVIIDHGRVIAEGAPAELKARAGLDMVEVHTREADTVAVVAEALDGLGAEAPQVDLGTRRITLPVIGGTEGLRATVRVLDDLGVAVDDVGLRRPTLDEVFLALTGQPTDAAQETQEVPA